ncbi:MAG: hypothetical protein WC455_28485 [Dehalococcoidia bacterium]|jgi:hypothetical protein
MKRSKLKTLYTDGADHYAQSAQSLALKISVGLEKDCAWEEVRDYQTMSAIYRDMAAGRRIVGTPVPSIEVMEYVE